MKHFNTGRAMVLGLLSITASAQAAEFRGLGDLTSTQRESTGNAISGDGCVAVGRGMSSGPEAFQWRQGSMRGLGALSTRPRESYAYGVSVNGGVVVGASASSIREACGDSHVTMSGRRPKKTRSRRRSETGRNRLSTANAIPRIERAAGIWDNCGAKGRLCLPF